MRVVRLTLFYECARTPRRRGQTDRGECTRRLTRPWLPRCSGL